MWRQLVLILGATCGAAGVLLADPDAHSTVLARPAVVEIKPQPPGRRLIKLPALEFPLTIRPSCEPADVASVSISVADTRHSIPAASFADGIPIETLLRLPGRQIAPVAVDAFCIAGESQEPRGASKDIPDVLTANVALRCRTETGVAVSYESLALDVRLLCADPASAGAADERGQVNAPAAAAEPQDASSSVTTRF